MLFNIAVYVKWPVFTRIVAVPLYHETDLENLFVYKYTRDTTYYSNHNYKVISVKCIVVNVGEDR